MCVVYSLVCAVMLCPPLQCQWRAARYGGAVEPVSLYPKGELNSVP